MTGVYKIKLDADGRGWMATVQQAQDKFTKFTSVSLKNQNKLGGSLNMLQSRLDRLNHQRGATASIKDIKVLNEHIRMTERRMNKLKNLSPTGFIGNIRKASQAFMTAFPYAGLAGAILGFKELISFGAGFDSAMSNVKALSGATNVEFEHLKNQATQLGATTVFSAKQAADGMGFLAQAGFKTKEIMDAMPGTLNLAAASTTELASTADIASNILSGFGIEAFKFSGVADKLALTTAKSNTNLTQLGESLKYSAPMARVAKQSLSEVLALTGKMADMGIQGTLSGTALSMAFSRLQAPKRLAQKVISKLGLQIKKPNGELRSLVDIIEELHNKGASAADTIHLFGQEAGAKLVGFVKDGVTEVRELTGVIEASQGAAERMAKVKLDNLGGDLTKLKSNFQGFVLDLYDKMKPALRTATQWINKLISGFSDLLPVVTDFFGTAKPLIIGFGLLMIGLRIKTNLTTLAMNLQASSLGRLGRAFKLATTKGMRFSRLWKIIKIALATNPLTLFATGLATVGVALYTGYKLFKKYNSQLNMAKKLTANVKAEVFQQKTDMNRLFDALQRTNPESQRRNDIIAELQEKYPDYLKNMNLEKASEEEIEIARRNANRELERGIILQAQKTEKEANYKKEMDASKKVFNELFESGKFDENELIGLQKRIDQVTSEKINSGQWDAGYFSGAKNPLIDKVLKSVLKEDIVQSFGVKTATTKKVYSHNGKEVKGVEDIRDLIDVMLEGKYRNSVLDKFTDSKLASLGGVIKTKTKTKTKEGNGNNDPLGDKIKSADAIISGGRRQTHFNITIQRLQDDTKIFVDSAQKGIEEMGDKVQEELLRTINGINQLQTG